MTIMEAARQVLQQNNKAMNVDDIYDEICKQDLYSFGAKDPKSVLSQVMRKSSDKYPKAKNIIFKSAGQGIYSLAE